MTLRATPLDQTSIQTGGRRRELAKSRLARRGYYRVTHGAGRRPPGGAKVKAGGASSSEQADRRRKSSLFRRLSSKRASAEIQQVSSSYTDIVRLGDDDDDDVRVHLSTIFFVLVLFFLTPLRIPSLVH